MWCVPSVIFNSQMALVWVWWWRNQVGLGYRNKYNSTIISATSYPVVSKSSAVILDKYLSSMRAAILNRLYLKLALRDAILDERIFINHRYKYNRESVALASFPVPVVSKSSLPPFWTYIYPAWALPSCTTEYPVWARPSWSKEYLSKVGVVSGLPYERRHLEAKNIYSFPISKNRLVLGPCSAGSSTRYRVSGIENRGFGVLWYCLLYYWWYCSNIIWIVKAHLHFGFSVQLWRWRPRLVQWQVHWS